MKKSVIGKQVIGSLGTGTITRIITNSTGYVEVDYAGKIKNEMAFNLKFTDGTLVMEKPVKSAETKIETKPKTEMERLMEKLMYINRVKQSPSLRQIYSDGYDIYANLRMSAGSRGLEHLANSEVFKNDVKPNPMVASITDNVMKYSTCSAKQAFVLAKYIVENRNSYFFKNINF